MIKNSILCWLAAAVLGGGAVAETNAPGTLEEVVAALREKYVDREKLDAAMIDAATVKGILNALGRGAVLLGIEPAPTNDTVAVTLTMTNAPANPPPLVEPLARAEIIEPNIGYIRLADITAAAVTALDEELAKFDAARCDGFILDLRFADGSDWAAAAAVASRFFAEERDLFLLKSAANGSETFRAQPPPGALRGRLATAPLMLLVNSETRGAAEALVGALRAQDRGVVVGSLTAGAPAAVQDIPLRGGQILRVATRKIVLTPREPGSLSQVEIFPHGVAPDLYVPLALTTERDLVLNAATNVTLTVSLQPQAQKKRMSEADLMRVFRGEAVDVPAEETAADRENGEPPKARDVVLQRAVDVLKGIRVLLTWQ
jgi:hypothetical protein